MNMLSLVIWLTFIIASADLATQPATTQPATTQPKTEITVNAGTQEDAEAALERVRSFLQLWEQGKIEKALAFVRPSVRDVFREELARKTIVLHRIKDLRVFEHHSGIMLARVHVEIDPPASRPDLAHSEMGIDMVREDGTWWINVR